MDLNEKQLARSRFKQSRYQNTRHSKYRPKADASGEDVNTASAEDSGFRRNLDFEGLGDAERAADLRKLLEEQGEFGLYAAGRYRSAVTNLEKDPGPVPEVDGGLLAVDWDRVGAALERLPLPELLMMEAELLEGVRHAAGPSEGQFNPQGGAEEPAFSFASDSEAEGASGSGASGRPWRIGETTPSEAPSRPGPPHSAPSTSYAVQTASVPPTPTPSSVSGPIVQLAAPHTMQVPSAVADLDALFDELGVGTGGGGPARPAPPKPVLPVPATPTGTPSAPSPSAPVVAKKTDDLDDWLDSL